VPDGHSVDEPTNAAPVFHPGDVGGSETVTLQVEVSDGEDRVTGSVDVVVQDAGPPVDFVIDNRDEETASTGTWTASSLSGGYAGESLYSRGQSADTFRFLATFPLSGSYRVSAWWTAHENRSRVAPYEIVGAGQSTIVTANQEQNAEQWNELGVFEFAAGEGQYVEISAVAADGDIVVADAVRFEYVGG
jgi:hypothetical protein